MRGTLRHRIQGHAETGIIPAHAGNTSVIASFRFPGGDHPRACGEHPYERPLVIADLGSSPRMRGTRHRRRVRSLRAVDHPRACGEHGIDGEQQAVAAWIIPAHAGNTSVGVSRSVIIRDHPRACGEHQINLPVVNTQPWIIPAHAGNTIPFPLSSSRNCGSSPRMRGTLYCRPLACRVGGIIPAHAGNTVLLARKICSPWDHPRACGEHLRTFMNLLLRLGSSPRMRGTLPLRSFRVLPMGIIPAHAGNTAVRKDEGGAVRWIIPAHAGNTCLAPASPRLTRDHPRACGEHKKTMRLITLQEGSSPRMRGTLFPSSSQVVCFGIIPAHAGNTYFSLFWRVFCWDHPRACGEHDSTVSDRDLGRGSSPRMRGTRVKPNR